MLSKPNVKDIMPKVGTRYEVAVAIAKRARQIADERLEEGNPDISDPVDVASKEIDSYKVKFVKEKIEEIEEVKETEIIDEDIIKEDIVE